MARQSFLVHPQKVPLVGEVRVPGDKSIGHRAVLLGALAEGPCRVSGLSSGEDNQRTVAAFQALGVPITRSQPGTLEISGQGLSGLRQAAAELDCGNSGTSLRLLSGVLAAQRFASTLTGDPYLCARPMRRVVEPLRQMGGHLAGVPGRTPGEIYPPLQILPAGHLRGIRYQSPVASAQVKSAILLCGLWAEGTTEVVEPSRSRDHTERFLRSLGVPVTSYDEDRAAVSRLDPGAWRRVLPPFEVEVPGDLSSAAFLLGAALLLPRSRVLVRGVGLNPTRTGFLDALSQMRPGAAVVIDEHLVAGEEVGDLLVTGSEDDLGPMNMGGTLSLRALDELPLLAALAGAAQGETVISGAAELRVKESDRIAATCALLRAFSVECEEQKDGLVIRGRGRGGLKPAQVSSHGDHRIAMAAAVLSLLAPGPSRIEDVDNVATSYPGFAATLGQLGAGIELI